MNSNPFMKFGFYFIEFSVAMGGESTCVFGEIVFDIAFI